MTQDEAMEILRSDRNVLLIGAGGTGKTTLLKKFIEESDKKIIVCAPTGTAAVNIEGSTVHSVFGVPIPAYGAKISDVKKNTFRILRKADIVIIDEISMLRCDVFSFVIRVMDAVQKNYGKKLRLICSGDFSQLPPVVKKEEAKMLKEFNFDVSGFPFTTKEWAKCKFKTIELTDIVRQTDTEFIEHLNEIREGKYKKIDYFNQFLITDERKAPEKAIYICGTNAEAERINTRRLNDLKTQPMVYYAEIVDRNNNTNVEKTLVLKPEERVMFTVNDTLRMYQNGTLGTVLEVNENDVKVLTDDGNIVKVGKYKWISYKYTVSGNELHKEEIGSIEQIPLKAAWAVTIHKSQGKTFDQAIISPKTFAPGQLYVALSRLRSTQGLFLTQPLKEEYVITDRAVSRFYKNEFSWDKPTNNRVTKKPKKKPVPKASTTAEEKKTAKKSSAVKKKTVTTDRKSKTVKSAKPSDTV